MGPAAGREGQETAAFMCVRQCVGPLGLRLRQMSPLVRLHLVAVFVDHCPVGHMSRCLRPGRTRPAQKSVEVAVLYLFRLTQATSMADKGLRRVAPGLRVQMHWLQL